VKELPCAELAGLTDAIANSIDDVYAAKVGELLAIKERRSELPYIFALLQARKVLCHAFSELYRHKREHGCFELCERADPQHAKADRHYAKRGDRIVFRQ
jgi:hypothetical protein